ncbi:TadE/TadG family type IV pilus assembly protein [Antarctobacter sp.]|uniref:TadE/TadG family type IV pilus assembly protein n=1 Tax=Antarctobacter sp. TaxID=1872577 RepID=UPI003A8E821C
MRLPSFLTRFASDTRGFVNVEAVIVFPALLFLFGVGWTYFDAFRQQAVNQKANYVIGDMISRETTAITPDYLTNAQGLLRHLTKTTGTDSDLRVTVVQYSTLHGGWSVVWSDERGDQPVLTTGDLALYADKLPSGTNGDQLILVETWDAYNPVLSVGLDSFEIRTYSFTRPRYAPQVVYQPSA